MITWQINIQGIVQGVGFRPHLFLVAQKNNFKIHVYNNGIGVKVLFNAKNDVAAYKIAQIIVSNIPKKAIIDTFELLKTNFLEIKKNRIFQEQSKQNTAMITPDMAWCDSCKTEYLNPENSRNNFPFIACTDCGSRFSIWEKMPFERENTTMNLYAMCTHCQTEYHDFQHDKRAFSQLNSCKKCNFKSSLIDSKIENSNEQLGILSKKIKIGELAVIKGVSGFLFVLDYKNEQAIENLRKLKNRPTKPFAIMAKDINWVIKNFEISDKELKEITSSVAPIVLLQPKTNFLNTTPIKSLCGNSQKVGIMLASSGFLYQICKNNNGAIVATSGNISGFPIEFLNNLATQNLSKYTKNIWYYDREIIFPQDDSVIQFSPYYKQKIVLRRARGLAPSEFYLPKYKVEDTVLALGSEQKSTFTLAYESQLLVSQYLGKLNNIENLDRFELVIKNLLRLTQTTPNIVLIDEHPQFNYKKIIAENPMYKNCKIVKIQHHIAHLGAIMGEHNLFNLDEKILGIVFDGMGYSLENTILGGEFFVVQNNQISTKTQMPFFRYLMNDAMAIQPRLCYFSLCESNVNSRFTNFYSKIETHNFASVLPKQIATNSIGRVFDALAFCLGFEQQKQSFEGEAALYLNDFFEKGLLELGIEFAENYLESDDLIWKNVFEKINIDLDKDCSKNTIAFKFLNTIVNYSIEISLKQNIKKMALSGGVFQNGVLVDLFQYHCNTYKINLYLHKHFSPNDENISFGQVMAFRHFKN